MRSTVTDPQRADQHIRRRTDAICSEASALKKALTALLCLWSCFPSPAPAAPLVEHRAFGVRLAAGFEITQFSDEKLADDIQTMTVDGQGRVLVSGPGYIRWLVDTNLDGRADIKIDYAATPGGGMGLYGDGVNLAFVGDQGLWSLKDLNGDGMADGTAVKNLNLRTGEHGAHGLRQGPDGLVYLVAGNDAEAHAGLITDPHSPVRSPEAGCVLRISPDFKSVGIFAHGLRNPYDLDFNWLGDLFTFDSDVEREFLLPWYTPTRVYHLGYGGHHGWRLPGFQRSFHRPDSDPGTVPMTRSMGRGSPTAVVAYRHLQFPSTYQNGLFLMDWTFGRILFTPAIPDGSSYQLMPDVFLEPMGTDGFAPTAGVVAPDGSLLVSVGGRKTRGSVYKIRYTQDPMRLSLATNWFQLAKTDVDLALLAPQPLAAWSRSIWKPIASRLGPQSFDSAVLDSRLPDSMCVRAVEILTEVHGGMMTSTAQLAVKHPSPFVRARVAWSLGRTPCKEFAPLLLELSKDPSPLVRRNALEAMLEQVEWISAPMVAQAALASAAHTDKHLRMLSARLATLLPVENWKAYYASLMRLGASSQLACSLAVAWRFPTNGLNEALIYQTLRSLKNAQTPAEKLQGVMLLVQGMGDWRVHSPSSELYTAYEAQFSPNPTNSIARRMADTIRDYLKSDNKELIRETARLLAMLGDSDPLTASLVLDQVNTSTAPGEDFHFLTVLSKLAGKPDRRHTERISEALLNMTRKVRGLDNQPKQTWRERSLELYEALFRRDPNIPGLLLATPAFVRTENLPLALSLDFPSRQKAARLWLAALKQNPAERWTAETVKLLSGLPLAETRALLRTRWSDTDIRDPLLLALAREPDREDKEAFAWGLNSLNKEVINASLDALLILPREAGQGPIEEALRLLVRLGQSPMSDVRPGAVVQLINRLTGQRFPLPESGATPAQIRLASQAIFDWCAPRFPSTARLGVTAGQSAVEWEALLQQTAWDKGDAEAGSRLFQARQCVVCHGGVSGIGPDLTGATRRWSPKDLMGQIRYPNREIAEAYRATKIETRDGAQHLGIVAYYSAEGVILRTAEGRTERIAQSEIVKQRAAEDSIMPEGLLQGLGSQDLADLYAFLRLLDSKP